MRYKGFIEKSRILISILIILSMALPQVVFGDQVQATQPGISYAATKVTKVYGDATFTNPLTSTGITDSVSYSSSSPTVATVDSATGEVTIAGTGDTIITATAGSTSATYTLTVANAPLELKADNKSMTAGTALPPLTYTVTGLVNGDTVTAEPTLVTEADVKTAGAYAIAISGGTVKNRDNYEIKYTPGSLSVIASVAKDYTFDSKTGTLTVYTDAGTTRWRDSVSPLNVNKIIIESTVTSIGDYAFMECNINSIVTPNSVTAIGIGAFAKCGELDQVKLSDHLTILGEYAFCDTKLICIDIPKGVNTIGEYTFSGCKELISAIMQGAHIAIGEGAFVSCIKLKSIDMPGVVSIGDDAFRGCSELTSISISKGTTSIGDYAFGGCEGLTYAIFLPEIAPKLGIGVFGLPNQNFKIAVPTKGTGYNSDGWEKYQNIISIEMPSRSVNYTKKIISKIYGDSTFTNPLTVSGEEEVINYSSDNPSVATIDSAGEVTIVGAGAASITATAESATAIYTLTVAKAPLELKADNKSMEAGGTVPELTYTTKGLVNGDTITEPPVLSCSADGKAAVTYTIAISGGTVDHATNYEVKYTPGSLTVVASIAKLSYAITEVNKVFGDSKFTNHLTATGSIDSISYSSSNINVATVDSVTGEVTIGGEGNAVIMATAGSTTATYTLAVAKALQGDCTFDSKTGTLVIYTNEGTTKWKEYVKNPKIIKKVSIQDGVTSIGSRAFYNCSGLTSVTIPNSVESIRNDAFYGCTGLSSIVIPKGVTSIGVRAFYYCSGLESMSFKSKVAPSLDSYAISGGFYFKIHIPKGTTGYTGSTRNPDWYEYQWAIVIDQEPQSISYQDNIVSKFYGDRRFTNTLTNTYTWSKIIYSSSNSSVATVDATTGAVKIISAGETTITATVTEAETKLGATASYTLNVGKATATLKADNKSMVAGSSTPPLTYTVIGLVNGDTVTEEPTLVTEADVKTAGTYAITISGGTVRNSDNYEIKYTPGSLYVAAPVVGDYTFDTTTGTLTIYTDAGTTSWREGIDVSNVKNVVILPDVTSIGDNAFTDCSKLTSITIPDSVTRIGNYAFCRCSLREIRLPSSLISINESVLSDCELEYVIIPESVTEIGDHAFDYDQNLTSVTMGDNVKRIGDYGFGMCYKLKHIDLSKKLTSIGSYAFYHDYRYQGEDAGLESIAIPEGVTSIGDNAFLGCRNLEDASIPSTLINWGKCAFEDCEGLKNVKIANGVKSIGASAFNICVNLESIVIPRSVTSIGGYCFTNCPKLKCVIFKSKVAPSIGSGVFGNSVTAKLMVPMGDSVAGYTGNNLSEGWKAYQDIIEQYKEPWNISYPNTTVSKSYGNAKFTNPLTNKDTADSISYASSDTNVATVDATTGVVKIISAGETTITATATETDTKAEATASYKLNVAKAPLALKADDKSMTAGDPLPEFTYTATGLVNGDTITEAPTLSATGDSGTAGNYGITISGGTVMNGDKYDIAYTAGSLTVAAPTPQPAPTPKPTPTPGGGGSGGGGGSSSAPSKQEYSNVKVEGDKAVITATTTNAKDGSITVNLPKVVQEEIIREKVNNTAIVVNKPTVSINLNLAAVTTINKQANADVQLTAKVVKDVSSLGSAAKAAVGTRPVYDLKASYDSGTKHVKSFGEGQVAIEIPYALQRGEVASNVCAVYVDNNGKVSYLSDSKYDTKTQAVKFTTNHFSVYGVGYKTHFKDIKNHWAESAIQEVADAGLMSGTSVDTFSPNTPMTRGMFITTIGRMEGAPTYNNNTKFADVKPTTYYAPYIAWATSRGLVSGTSKTTFSPDSPITREQMAVIMSKAFGTKLTKEQKPAVFKDGDKISSWAKDAVSILQQAGVLSGRSDGTFDPKATATRAEVASILNRLQK